MLPDLRREKASTSMETSPKETTWGRQKRPKQASLVCVQSMHELQGELL